MNSPRSNLVTLTAGGDIACLNPNAELTTEHARLIAPVLREADLRFAQCENTYSERIAATPLAHKIQTHASARQATLWDALGINVISMAGNNAMKMGPDVMLDTVGLLRTNGKHVIGAGRNIQEARQPALVECNGVKIAFLAYCSIVAEGDAAESDKPGIAPMRADTYYLRGGDPMEASQPGTPQEILTVPYADDLRQLQEDIRNAKQLAPIVVVSMHWGIHLVPKTIATYQPQVAHAAIDAGADLILGHHPHCLKAVEVYKGKVCFYSLGNFLMISDPKLALPSRWSRWKFWWYRMEPEYMPPHGMFHYPPDANKTMIAKITFSKQGVDRVAFLPAHINPQAQPAVVPPADPRFREIVDYIEWLSDQHPHKFRVEDDEVVIET